jgi:hypothetical protein
MKRLKYVVSWGGGVSYTLDFDKRSAKSKQDRFLERLPDFVATARVVWWIGADGHDYTYGPEWEWRTDAPDGRMGDEHPNPAAEAASEETGTAGP